MILDLITRAVAEEEAVAEVQPSWFENAFGDFAEFPVGGWILVAVLLVGGLVVYRQFKSESKTVWSTRMLALGAVCMALSNVLSMIKLFDMPQGGSITPASMLPLMLFAYVYGVGPGMTVGAVYGVMQFMIEPYFLSVPQMLLDYPIAFAMVGLAGLFSKNENRALGLSLGVVLGSLGRFVAAVLSGVVFFAEYAGDQNPWVYSIGYNGAYMLPECIICVVLALAVGLRLTQQLSKAK
jgi:thiamine transporter